MCVSVLLAIIGSILGTNPLLNSREMRMQMKELLVTGNTAAAAAAAGRRACCSVCVRHRHYNVLYCNAMRYTSATSMWACCFFSITLFTLTILAMIETYHIPAALWAQSGLLMQSLQSELRVIVIVFIVFIVLVVIALIIIIIILLLSSSLPPFFPSYHFLIVELIS